MKKQFWLFLRHGVEYVANTSVVNSMANLLREYYYLFYSCIPKGTKTSSQIKDDNKFWHENGIIKVIQSQAFYDHS